VVGCEVGNTQVHKTDFGYSIQIDPKQDPDGKISRGSSRARRGAYNVFIARTSARSR
jgi:hypothetical protein